MINRTLKKRREIDAFTRILEKETDVKKRMPEQDYLISENWRIIEKTHAILASLYY
jgi:hypothetical protein